MVAVEQIEDGNPQKDVLAAYVADYAARFGAPPSTFGGYAHDALALVRAAIETSGSAEPRAIRDALEATTGFVGATGVFNFSPEDHNGLDPSSFVMVGIENGAWKVLR
jgi:branched-chain amino acid transport system substrate-binding protein